LFKTKNHPQIIAIVPRNLVISKLELKKLPPAVLTLAISQLSTLITQPEAVNQIEVAPITTVLVTIATTFFIFSNILFMLKIKYECLVFCIVYLHNIIMY
jgi:hypothetical protein